MESMITFYDESKAPSVLKSVVLKLLSRMVVKLRYTYNQLEANSLITPKIKGMKHLQRLFISSDFIQGLFTELFTHMEKEKHSQDSQSRAVTGGNIVLHNAFVQDAIEFLMLAMVPTEQNMALQSYHQLIENESFQFPEWMDPLVRISYFLHFFRKDI